MDMKILVLVVALLGLGFVYYLSRTILRHDEGNQKMKDISLGIRQGAMAFLRREYITLGIYTIVLVIVLAIFIEPRPWTALAYLFGTVTSATVGFVGMSIATRANARTANTAISSWAKALKLAFSSGAVMGFSVVCVGLLGLTIVVIAFPDNIEPWLGFAFGSTSVALFLRVGGGIFTKSADVGADLVGKIEKNIPEDDPRNAAVIADNVGDNVGDIAGMGSDLYESYVSAIAASMVLGMLAIHEKGIILPMLLGALGIVVSIIGVFFVRPKDFKGTFDEQVQKAQAVMNRGVNVSNVLMIVGSFLICIFYLPDGGLPLFWANLIGLAAGFIIAKATEYYTSTPHKPVLGIAKASQTGAATNIIEGLSVGMLSTVIPVIVVALATVGSYQVVEAWRPGSGLLGIAIASMGMIINLGILLAMDCYGPIVDNAAGIAQMTGLGKEIRERCEALDAVGNTTAALGKGFAITSAALAALAWLATYFEVANIKMVDMTSPTVIAGLFIGGMIVYLFCALAMRGVGRGAYAVAQEVRRQFKEIKGLMEGTAKPDYVRPVDLATKAALSTMVLPGVVVVVVPLIVGFTLGVDAVAGVLTGALLVGLLVAIMMSNSGGAWDNAKKYIEAGNYGGKGSDAHKAAVCGDTVGDPFKDTAGPSLNILIKLVGKLAVIFAPLFLIVQGIPK